MNRLVLATAAASMLAPTALAAHSGSSTVALAFSNVGGTDYTQAVHVDFDPYAGVGSIDGAGYNCPPYAIHQLGGVAKYPSNWPAWIVQTASASIPLLPGTGSLGPSPTNCGGQAPDPQHVQVGASTLHLDNTHLSRVDWVGFGSAVRVGPDNDASSICAHHISEPITLSATPPHGPAPLPNTIASHGGAGPCISLNDDFDWDGEEPNTEPGTLVSWFFGIPIAERYGNNFGLLEFCFKFWVVGDSGQMVKSEDYTYSWYDGPGNSFAGVARVAHLEWDFSADFGPGGRNQRCVL